MAVKAPRGTRDISIGDSYKWQYIEEKIRACTALFHYKEIRTPIFEHTELFLRGVGDTTDIVQKEMYTFLDKGERSITLRPEGTAGVVRSFIETGLVGGPQPTKLYYLAAPVFRYENPQAGRLRQHHQFGIEIFGAKDASADAEAITLAYQVLSELGVNENLVLNINSIGCKECRPKYNAALKEYYQAHEAELCHSCKERLERNPLRLLDCKEEHCTQLAEQAPRILDYLCADCESHFTALQAYLAAAKIDYVINPKIVRGLDYYTKTVFEIVSNQIGSQGTVCGGGRYDGLIKELDGPEMPGVGFGMGMERLLMVMENAGVTIPQPEEVEIFLCTMGDAARKKAFSYLLQLRKAGIAADMDHNARSLKAQFKFADKMNAKYVITIGENEIAEDEAKLRDMQDGTEKTVVLSAPLTWIREK
ncbi:MAG: histidine--tRNA ligase [Christensenellaceae bacterium]